MKHDTVEAARQVLTNYLEQNNCRKTPERYAILETVYDFDTHFSIQELDGKLANSNFHVSKATIYNTLKLFMRLRLVVALKLQEGVRYKACFTDNEYVSVCTVCGRITNINQPEITEMLDKVKLKRFRKECFSLYIYGICSTCQAMMTRLDKRNRNNKNKNR